MASFDSWSFLAGLSLFVFALLLIEESLKALAGRPFKKFLQAQTAHKARAMLGSAALTGILQSSSVVLLITLSFVGAGIMSMRNALAVVLGANLGTTIDSWIIAWLGFRFDIERFAYPMLAVSLVGTLFYTKRRIILLWSRFFLGIGLLFIGLSFMKSALDNEAAINLLKGFTGWSPHFFILIGFLVTAIIQSSFATMTVALAVLSAGALPIEHAAGIIVGSELGTALKMIFGANGNSLDKRRVAWGNIIFNTYTVIIGGVLLLPLTRTLKEDYFSDPLLTLVAFQSLLNLFTIFTFYPFLGNLAHYLESTFSQKDKNVPLIAVELLDPPAAISALENQINCLFKQMVAVNRRALELKDLTGVSADAASHRFRWNGYSRTSFNDDYGALKQFHGELLEAASDVLQQEFPPAESERLGKLLAASRNILHAAKNVKDIRHNLKELNDSANDNLYGALMAIKDKELSFYERLEKLLDGKQLDAKERDLLSLDVNDQEQEELVRRTLEVLHHHRIKEYEAATLVNVYRELHSSHKAIIKAMLVLSEGQRVEQSSTFQAV